MENKELERMKTSYGYLFEIEYKTKKRIRGILESKYGFNSLFIIRSQFKNKLSNKSLDNMQFHEMISYLKMVPVVNEAFGENIIKELSKISLIRNKIAHCKILNEEEFDELSRVFHLFEKNRYN